MGRNATLSSRLCHHEKSNVHYDIIHNDLSCPTLLDFCRTNTHKSRRLEQCLRHITRRKSDHMLCWIPGTYVALCARHFILILNEPIQWYRAVCEFQIENAISTYSQIFMIAPGSPEEAYREVWERIAVVLHRDHVARGEQLLTAKRRLLCQLTKASRLPWCFEVVRVFLAYRLRVRFRTSRFLS